MKVLLIFIIFILKSCFSSNDEIIDLNFILPQQHKTPLPLTKFNQVMSIEDTFSGNKNFSQNFNENIGSSKIFIGKSRFSLFPNHNIFQNVLIYFLQSQDLIKLFEAFKKQNIQLQYFFPKCFQSNIILNVNGGFLNLFTFFPEFKNLIPILYCPKNHNVWSVAMNDVDNTKKTFFYSSENLIPFQFSHPLEDEQDALLAIYNGTNFILVVKNNKNFLSTLYEGKFLRKEKRSPTSIILDIGNLDFYFPNDVEIILNAKNYSKKFLFKMSYAYLNLITCYYKKMIPISEVFEYCSSLVKYIISENSIFHLIFSIIAYVLFFIFLAFIGYPFILAFPLYFETHIFLLPFFLWNPQPNLIYYTSIFAAMFAPIHLEHFSVIHKIHAKPKTIAWLLAQKRTPKLCNFFFFLVAYGNLYFMILLYTYWNISPFINFLRNLITGIK